MTTSTANAAKSATPQNAWVAAMPAVFVLIWSTGFIVAKFGLPYAPPLTFLLLRFVGVLLVLGPLVLLMRAPWPAGKVGHIALAGVLVQAGYLGGVWCAIKMGMPAGLSALIVGMQPILTAFAAPLIGEKVRGRQWLGLAFGIGGVGLVVANKISLIGLTWHSIALCLLALVSITVGTMYQKRHCPQFDLRTGTLIHTSYLPARFRWLARTQPELLAASRYWLSFGEYLLWQLTGCRAASYSVAAWSGLLNRRSLTWDRGIELATALQHL